ncbi:type II secretion system F family protein [Candidatus Falkowbacteria bacterium]|nr:type II secretion system F family protein [Candidatus Falkowbacteria bacterium]
MVVNLKSDIIAPQAAEQPVAQSLIAKINNALIKMSPIPADEKLFFVRNLCVMLKAGVPLLSALQTLCKQSVNKHFIQVITDTSKAVEKGKSFTEALKLNPDVFGELFINMVEAGEVSGKLENVLDQLYIQMKKHHELISKIKGALTYPAVVLFAMGGIGIFMMLVVVPQITSMLKDFNTELPLATKIIIGVSDFLAKNTTLALILIVAAIYVFIRIYKTTTGRYYFDLLMIKMPIFGKIIKKVNLAKFARTVSSLLKTDIMIIKSFQITANVLGNIHYRAAINDIGDKIKKGTPINEVVATYPKLFPPIVTQMIAIGEQTGELDSILQELAEFYEEEVDTIMESLPSIIEPVLILVLGSAVGVMAVAIVMPMYSITTSV